MADDLGFATKYSKKNPKPITSSRGTQKDINAIKKRAGVLGDAVGQGADDSYKKFTQQRQTQQQQVQQQQQKQTVKPPEPPKNNLLRKVAGVAKDFGSAATVGEKQFMTPIARKLSNNADVRATEDQAASTTKNVKFIKDQQKAGKLNKDQATKLLNLQAKNANETSKAQTKTLKELPSKKQVALGAASTAADILSGGTYGAAVKGAQAGKVIKGAQMAENTAKAKKATVLLSKGGKVKEYAKGAAGIAATNGAAGGLNAAAGGGDKKSVALNASIGAMLPSALHIGATTLANGGAKTAEKLSASQSKLLKPLKAVSDTATGDAKQGTRDIQNYQRTALLNKAREAQPNKVMATRVDPELVKQGVITGEVKHTSVHEITIGAEHAGKKIDNAKVKQYEKQIKDGEPIEPVVTHEVNGKTIVVDGQHRLAAMQNLGVKEIPTVEKLPGAKPGEVNTTLHEDISKPENVISVDGKHHELSGQAMDDYVAAKAKHDAIIKSNANDKSSFGDSRRKAAGMQLSAEKRRITGRLTGIEQQTIVKRERSMHIGKQVELNVGGKTIQGKIASAPAFGNVKVELADGRTISVKHADLPTDKRTAQEILSKHMQKEGVKPYAPKTASAPAAKPATELPNAEVPATTPVKTATGELKVSSDPIIASKTPTKAVVEKPVAPAAVEQGTSKVAQRIAKDLKDQYGELAHYDKITIKDQAAKAEKLLSNREELNAVISGTKPLPDGLRATSIITAVRANKELSKDVDLLRKLASSPLASESSLSAQELRLARENAKHDPVMAMRALQEKKIKAAERRAGKTLGEVEKETAKAVSAAKPKVTKETWESFLEGIKCH